MPGTALYRVADTNLRLYLGILRVRHEQARRGRHRGLARMRAGRAAGLS
ncbi:hypothetical protein [Actinoallomurus soli]|nr:hypothetical protein [Actinoallomurus soli]MCO5972051.1 hypothetical protein [Actinoallomurus soli]